MQNVYAYYLLMYDLFKFLNTSHNFRVNLESYSARAVIRNMSFEFNDYKGEKKVRG